MRRNLAFYSLLVMFITVLMKISGLLSKIVITKYLSPLEYGILTFVTISLPLMFQFVTNLSFFNLLSHSKKGKHYFKFSLFYVILSCAVIIALFYIFLDKILTMFEISPDYAQITFLTFSLLLFPMSVSVVLMGLFRGLRKYSVATITSSLPTFLKFVFIAILAVTLQKLTLNLTILATVISTWVALLAIVAYEWQTIKSSIHTKYFLPKLDMFLFSLSIFTVGSYGTLLQIIGRLIIAYDIDVTYQGYLDISITLMTLLSIPMIALSFLTIPEATSANTKEELLTGEINDVARLLLSILVFLVIIVSIYPHELIMFLFSSKYSPAAEYVVFLAVGSIFMFIQQFIAYVEISFYETLSEYRPFVIFTIACLVLFLATTHILVILFGFIGVYVSNLLFKVVYFAGSLKVSSKKTAKIFLTKIERLTISTVATISFLLVTKGTLNFIFEIAIAAIIFTLLVVKTKYFDLRKLLYSL
ncbi:Polysaccharide biosynthesis protein [Geoglobus ahangari]|uniref:Polysaccharide biosynthesis protein n=2 Tax=Geoglobus ahangari TaxID=113653 RepID=A0A0F7IGN3_9EURY|nr:Polysaccharide biosynthesis protein [Geoglobus ahangari]